MALIDDIRPILRVTSDAFDAEIEMLISAAQADMLRVGVEEEYVSDPDNNPLVKHAIACYCKANFGYDEADASRFDGAYRQLVCDMLNSYRNIAAIAQAEQDDAQ